MDKKINKAKELYNKFGPSEVQRKQILKLKTQLAKQNYAYNKKENSWFVQSDASVMTNTSSQERQCLNSSFRAFTPEKKMDFTPVNKIKVLKNKKHSVAFEIERVNQAPIKRAQTARGTKKSTEAEWEFF